MKYMGYKIERIDPNQVGNYGNKWGVFAENHDVDPTGRSYTHGRLPIVQGLSKKPSKVAGVISEDYKL